jgi:methylmalonyl-CoA/ethylmalonyl-CoA epimerase
MANLPSKIGQISVNIRDLARAVGFYKNVVGLTYLFEMSNGAFFQCGEVRVALTIPTSDAFDHPASIIYYQVDNLDDAHDRLLAWDANVLQPPHLVAKMADHALWMCFFNDGEGNVLAFMEERR